MSKVNKILCIYDSFKGSLSSKELGMYSKEVLKDLGIEADYLTIADGGEGTNEVLKSVLNLEERELEVMDLNKNNITSSYLHNQKTAYIESAKVIGLNLKNNDVKNCTSYGIGQMIIDAYDLGIREFVIGLGGTGTSDAGLGLLEALGLEISHQKKRKFINPVIGVEAVNAEKLRKYKACKFTILSDVTNKFIGAKGANMVFAKQKGATDSDIELLERNFEQIDLLCNKKLNDYIGGGAAGGISATMSYYLDAMIVSGIETLLNYYKFDQLVEEYDLIFTGEGSFDLQSLDGKVIKGISERAKGTPIIVFAGAVDPNIKRADLPKQISYFSIQTKPCSLDDALSKEQTKINLKSTIENAISLLNI